MKFIKKRPWKVSRCLISRLCGQSPLFHGLFFCVGSWTLVSIRPDDDFSHQMHLPQQNRRNVKFPQKQFVCVMISFAIECAFTCSPLGQTNYDAFQMHQPNGKNGNCETIEVCFESSQHDNYIFSLRQIDALSIIVHKTNYWLLFERCSSHSNLLST
jgi:hypothetical protein